MRATVTFVTPNDNREAYTGSETSRLVTTRSVESIAEVLRGHNEDGMDNGGESR
jgi:hypothetical protein